MLWIFALLNLAILLIIINELIIVNKKIDNFEEHLAEKMDGKSL